VNLAARNDLEKLLSETGHAFCLNDIDDVVELNRLAEEMARPGQSERFDPIGIPEAVGQHLLYPPTIGIIEWLAEIALPATEGATTDAEVVGYALSNAASPAVLWGLRGRSEIIRTVKKWSRGLKATPKDLARAIKKLMPQASTGAEEEERPYYGEVIAFLSREFCQDPAFFVWRCSIDRVRILLDSLIASKNAEIEAINRTSKGAKAAPIYSPKYAAVTAYQKHLHKMRKSWQ